MGTDKNMNRRDALKKMGSIAISTVVASSGLLSLTSCNEKRKRIILYFTGTGNSLYTARQLADENTELLSIPQLVKQGKYEFEADEIGIVFPIYGHMPPYMVRQFIKKASLKSKYKFAILTYGARKCNSVEIWNDISLKANTKFDYIITLIMVDNWLPNFDMNEQMKLDKHIPENIQKITADLKQNKHWHEPVTEEERLMHNGFMEFTGLDPEVGFLKKSEQYFVINTRCINCGVCTNVCPRANYNLTSNGIEIQGDCEFCFACIHNCPQKAIQFGKIENDPLLMRGEVNPNARYRNEHISLMDIKRSNNQF